MRVRLRRRPYLGESRLFGLLQCKDSSALQEAAEGQTLALTHRRHLPPSTQATVHLVELEHTRAHRRVVSQSPAGEGSQRRSDPPSPGPPLWSFPGV